LLLCRRHKRLEHRAYLSWLDDQYVDNQIHQAKELFYLVLVVLNLYLAWVDGIVADYTHQVQRLLNFLSHAFPNELAYILIQILPWQSLFFANHLDSEAQECGRRARRIGKNLPGFVVDRLYILRASFGCVGNA